VEAMKKIVEAERQASSLVTEARVYKTMLINKTKKRAEEQAASLLLNADVRCKNYEEETTAKIAAMKEEFSVSLKKIEEDINKQVSTKKAKLIEQLIVEVKTSDRSS
jgi:F0F1-type ATP synthase membrane subunit b/b'